MRIETRQQLQDVLTRCGTVWRVHGLGEQSFTTQTVLDPLLHEIVDKEFSCGSTGFLIEKATGLSKFSLNDTNIDGGGYNAHQAFDNPQEAAEYEAWCKENTLEPERDWFYDFYEDYPEDFD